MLKKTLFLSLVFLGVFKTSAQITFKPGVSFGLNLSTFQNSSLGYKTDYYTSVFGALKLSDFYTFQSEIAYSRQGAIGTHKDPYSIVSDEFDISFSYLSFQTINKFEINKQFFILFGPFMDFNFDSKSRINGVSTAYNLKKSDIDTGIILGFGYHFTKNLAFETRIKNGFLPAMMLDNGNGTTNKNFVLSIGSTYTFGK